MLLAALAALALAAASPRDTVKYVVLNHGRPAGEMLVITAGDTVSSATTTSTGTADREARLAT